MKAINAEKKWSKLFRYPKVLSVASCFGAIITSVIHSDTVLGLIKLLSEIQRKDKCFPSIIKPSNSLYCPGHSTIAAHYYDISNCGSCTVYTFYCFFALLSGQQGQKQQWKWLTFWAQMSHWHMAGIITKFLKPLGTIQPFTIGTFSTPATAS